eukprot:XP_011660695.1 PREDICTED: uncharacterized protein LOC100891866 isoform X2 [Strongylocentrotus purpuratus]
MDLPVHFRFGHCVERNFSRQTGVSLGTMTKTKIAPSQVEVGDTVDMVCTSEGGNPIPDLTWFRGEEELEENEGLRYAVHRQILRPQDTNIQYTCLMRGPMTTTRKTCSIRPMDVPPEVQIEPAVNSVKVGAKATFTCALMSTNNIGVRGYSWNVEPSVTDMHQSSPGRMQLMHSDRVLEIQDIREEDANTLVTCQAQTTNGELLTGTATLVILVEPTGMTTDSPDMTTVESHGGDAMGTDETDWQRAMRPTQEGTEFPNIDGYNANDAGVTVGMKPKFPAFLTGRTFIMTSAAAGAFILILIIVIIVIVKVVRRRNGKRIPITTPITVMEHGGSDAYATILEMKRKTGSTYKGSSTLPILKSERKIGLPDMMRGGSSLSLAARSATARGQTTERSPLYAKPEKIRSSKHGLFGDSKKNSLVESAEEPGVTESFKDGDQEKKAKETSNLNAEGLIYADLVLEDKEKSKRISTKKGTQYASIVPSGKP